jgi:L,D-transpeptidase catalytic domain
VGCLASQSAVGGIQTNATQINVEIPSQTPGTPSLDHGGVGGKLLIALGVVAGAVAVVSLAALALSAFDSGRATPAPAKVYVVEKLPGKAPASPGAQPSPVSAPVPALVERPVRGPAFAIARLRPGAREAMWSAPGGSFVETLGPRTEFGSPVILSVVRTRPDWLGVTSADMPNGRLGWIRRDRRRVEVYWTRYSLHANLSALRLSLDYGGTTVARFLVTVGAPESETPTGRFGITDALRFDESPFYGCCALALSGRQTHLPASWIGGDRLAIHGTPGPVGGDESLGCIRATDETMRRLFRRVPLGTPFFIEE